MPVVGTAATADDRQPRQQLAHLPILLAKLVRIAVVEIGAFVELGGAALRGVGAQAANALAPAALPFPPCSKWLGWAQLIM